MMDLFDYPNSPGYVRDSSTSLEAAKSMEGLAGNLRAKIRLFIERSKGATCDEVESAMDLRHQTASARITELRLLGEIEKTEIKRATRSGRAAYVYRAASA
jgi:predicted transcriptional regulator